MRLFDVYDFFKTRCPIHLIRYGFDWNYGFHKSTCIFVRMTENIKVSTMIGNLSHAVNAGHGNRKLFWPESPNTSVMEEVTLETLEEMGMKPNE